jgi:hypothetical protein
MFDYADLFALASAGTYGAVDPDNLEDRAALNGGLGFADDVVRGVDGAVEVPDTFDRSPPPRMPRTRPATLEGT